MASKRLIETNPITLVFEIEKSINEGYLVEASNEGYISTAMLYEIVLFKKEPPALTDILNYKTDIFEYDAMKFLLAIQNAILQGYKIKQDSVHWDNVGTKRCTVINKEHPTSTQYTKEELMEMDWDKMNDLAKAYGVKARGRNALAFAILNKQEENK